MYVQWKLMDKSPDKERKKQLEPPRKNHKKATSSNETD